MPDVHPRFAPTFACLTCTTAYNVQPAGHVNRRRRHPGERPTVRPVHYTDEVIDGRTYHIEVARISQDRWRAHVVRTPGVPTAMMPFYGPTASEAARQVSDWLTLAHKTSRAGSTGA
jgi:hypothetical protein